MRIALLTGAAALVLAGTAGAGAETIYVTEPSTVAPGYVYTAEPNYVVAEPNYAVRDRSYVVADPPAVVVAPRRERVVVVPRREREVVVEQPGYSTPRESYSYSYGYRGTWRDTWRGNGGTVTTSYSSSGPCVVDSNGFERCY